MLFQVGRKTGRTSPAETLEAPADAKEKGVNRGVSRTCLRRGNDGLHDIAGVAGLASAKIVPMSKSAPRDNEMLMRVADSLVERFRPFKQGAIPDESWTLHKAIRFEIGADPSLGLVAYANHVELREQVVAAYASLDRALAETGVDGRAEPWALSGERTKEELVELCRLAARGSGPDSPSRVSAVPRPSIPGLLGKGKYRGAICCVVAEVASATQTTFGKVVGSLAQLSVGTTDADLLAALEREPRAFELDPHSAADAAVTSVSAGKWLRTGRPTMTAYFGAVAEVLGAWGEIADLAAALEQFDELERADETGRSAPVIG